METKEKLGFIISNYRREQCVSQEDFAIRCGIGQRYLSDIEGGKRDVSITILEKLANGLGLRLSYLMELIEQEDIRESSNTIMLKFGSRVTEIRKSLGKSQMEFSQATGIGIRFLKEIESGTQPVSIPVIEVIARELGVGICELFE